MTEFEQHTDRISLLSIVSRFNFDDLGVHTVVLSDGRSGGQSVGLSDGPSVGQSDGPSDSVSESVRVSVECPSHVRRTE